MATTTLLPCCKALLCSRIPPRAQEAEQLADPLGTRHHAASAQLIAAGRDQQRRTHWRGRAVVVTQGLTGVIEGSHMTAFYDQTEFAVRFEWGEHGVAKLAPQSDVVVIVDVLSFSTCVDIATGNGAIILPYRWRDESAAAFAASQQALLAAPRWHNTGGYSLSPTSLITIPPGTRLVLPSPNGATLTLLAGSTTVLTGCLRNATAVAAMAEHLGRAITVIAAGERWTDGSLRPAVEDLLGAGAIINALSGTRSPEAAAAAAAFWAVQTQLDDTLRRCTSGQELIIRGFATDVGLASRLDESPAVPRLCEGVYVNHAR